MKNYKSLEMLKQANKVCIISHIDPDADALCSMVVLGNILKDKYKLKSIDLFAETENIADNYKEIIQNVRYNPECSDYDVAIMIDCPNTDRISCYEPLFDNAKTRIVIDHHDTNKHQGDINIVEVCSSACEIVFAIGEELKYKFTKADYAMVYAGLITDTGNFSVGRISPRTFVTASKCVEHVDYERLYRNFFSNNTVKNTMLYALAINNMKTYCDDRIVITHINKNEAKKYDVVADDYTGIINRLATIGKSRLVAFIHPKKGEYYVSMRARLGYDVSKIAVSHGGGGHVGAAAYLAKGSVDAIEKEMKKLFEEELNSKQEIKENLF